MEKEQQGQRKTKEKTMWKQRETEVMHFLRMDIFSEPLGGTNLDGTLTLEFWNPKLRQNLILLLKVTKLVLIYCGNLN